MTEPSPPSTPDRQVATPDQIQQFLNIQQQEIGLRARELDIAEQQSQQAHVYAMASLEAQKADRGSEISAGVKITGWRYLSFCIVTLLLIAFGALLAWLGKDQLLLEIIKLMAAFIAGAIGGAGYMKVRGEGSKSESNEDE